jgi:hypothetical protein
MRLFIEKLRRNKHELIILIQFALFLILFSCHDREFDNPFDNLDPAAWAPQNFQVTDVSITEKQLSWNYGDYNIEGFKLDRKKGDEEWQEEYQEFPKETRSWNDTAVVPDGSNYQYRLFAVAGDNASSLLFGEIVTTFPKPTNLNLVLENLSKIKLSWGDNSNGEDGFIIDRKIGMNSWESNYAVLGPNSTYWEGSNFPLNDIITYRILAFKNTFHSEAEESNINTEIPPPSNLYLSANSAFSVTLTWQDNSIGEDGFIIDRRENSGNWVSAQMVLQNDIESTNDNLVDFNSNDHYSYRVYAFHDNYFSTAIEGSIEKPCGINYSFNHISGDIAPVDETIIYGTIIENISGSPKCWITQNLGAVHQALSPMDDTEGSAGWYWQFNRKQGFMHDGIYRIPNTIWISSISEGSEWIDSEDPCFLLLGSGWRLPSYSEWNFAVENEGWKNLSDTYFNSLKIHGAGYLNFNDGSLHFRGSYGYYWSNSSYDYSSGRYMYIATDYCFMGAFTKAYTCSVRCLRDL